MRDDVDHLIEDALVGSMCRRDRQVLGEQRDHVTKPGACAEREGEVIGVPDVDVPPARREAAAPRQSGLVDEDRLRNTGPGSTRRRTTRPPPWQLGR